MRWELDVRDVRDVWDERELDACEPAERTLPVLDTWLTESSGEMSSTVSRDGSRDWPWSWSLFVCDRVRLVLSTSSVSGGTSPAGMVSDVAIFTLNNCYRDNKGPTECFDTDLFNRSNCNTQA